MFLVTVCVLKCIGNLKSVFDNTKRTSIVCLHEKNFNVHCVNDVNNWREKNLTREKKDNKKKTYKKKQ